MRSTSTVFSWNQTCDTANGAKRGRVDHKYFLCCRPDRGRGLAGYCATKGGVRLFTKAVAIECAAGDTNIRVNSVIGIIDTDIWGKKFPA